MRNFTILPIIALICLAACSKDPDPSPPASTDTTRTIIMYLPWSGPSYNLLDDFYNNILDFENTIKDGILKNERILVFISTSGSRGELFELEYNNGTVTRRMIKEYTDPALTTQQWIKSLLEEVKLSAPANNYAMIVGGHGMGWLPVSSTGARSMGGQKYHWEYDDGPRTRYFGGTTDQYKTDITTLASGITGADLWMDYILFDDCYMSTIEVAYELKDVTGYLIGCPTEVMAYGMPYELMGKYLVGTVDYEAVCTTFHDFYKNYDYPYGTIGVTDCSQVEALALIMKEINSRSFTSPNISGIQRMDGYSPVIFFDMGDYVSKLCTDAELLAKLEAQLGRTVPYSSHTPYYYSNNRGTVKIDTYSGITVSDPTTSSISAAVTTKKQTAWWKATHD